MHELKSPKINIVVDNVCWKSENNRSSINTTKRREYHLRATITLVPHLFWPLFTLDRKLTPITTWYWFWTAINSHFQLFLHENTELSDSNVTRKTTDSWFQTTTWTNCQSEIRIRICDVFEMNVETDSSGHSFFKSSSPSHLTLEFRSGLGESWFPANRTSKTRKKNNKNNIELKCDVSPRKHLHTQWSCAYTSTHSHDHMENVIETQFCSIDSSVPFIQSTHNLVVDFSNEKCSRNVVCVVLFPSNLIKFVVNNVNKWFVNKPEETFVRLEKHTTSLQFCPKPNIH